MKTRVVVFTDNNARVIKNPETLEDFTKLPNALVNPDLSEVDGVPTHYWVLKHGKVTVMSDSERKLRDLDIAKYGIKNEITSITPEMIKARLRKQHLTQLLRYIFDISGVILLAYVLSKLFS